jgi:uncharacterized protein
MDSEFIPCRPGCGACCIAPSISSPIPGMPDGKLSGVRCIHLTEEYLCGIFDSPDRPKVCDDFKADRLVCGDSREEGLERLYSLED